MRGSVLQVLHLHGHHGAGERAALPALVGLGGQQLRGQRRVQRVREQHELELHLQGTHSTWAQQPETAVARSVTQNPNRGLTIF